MAARSTPIARSPGPIRVRYGPGWKGPSVGVGDPLDLPVLQVHDPSASEEVDHRDEPVPRTAAEDRADEPGQRPAGDADAGADGVRRLEVHRKARGEHPVDLVEVALQARLV